MSGQREDYILRMIAEAALAARRLLARLRCCTPAETRRIQDEVERAEAGLLGPILPAARAVDAETAATMIGDPRLLVAWSDLLGVKVEAYRSLGDLERARATDARKRALLAAVAGGEPDAPRAGR